MQLRKNLKELRRNFGQLIRHYRTVVVNKEYIVEFKREGYETVTREIVNKVGAGWIVLDVLLGLVPVIVDAATGAWYHLNHTNLRVVLEKQQTDKNR